MGIILFLVDTSASMNQRTFLGTSYLDVAKGAIDTFMKYRTRDPASRGDRYMLVSFDEQPNAVKAGWKENHAAFVSELKSLHATGLTTFSSALREAFDLLNVHRLHTSIDHYGQGRNPFFLEPAVVIALTDGGKLTNSNTTEKELVMRNENNCDGSELTAEPFRWDQRLFTVLLRLPGMGGGGNSKGSDQQTAESSIFTMCEATGGKCYVVSNQKSLAQCMESLTQKLHPGVVINFQKIGGTSSPNNGVAQSARETTPMEIDEKGDADGERDKDTPPPSNNKSSTSWHNTRKMIFVRPNPKTNVPSGFWPIPESFWPDPNTTTLPPRDVHPVVCFSTTDTSPLLVENFPFDKYELEPSPLTQCILARRNPNVCWQVFVEGSGKQEGPMHPFGYLKASSSLTHVTFFVMPYNYPTLLPLIEELQRHHLRPPPKWRAEFNDYITSIPSYYAQPLRNALRLMGAPNLVPDSFDGQLSYSVTNYLRKLKKQAKLESERVVTATSRNRVANEATRKENGVVDLGDGISISIGSTQMEESFTSQSFRNPFDISRDGLLGQLARMRTNFLRASPTTPNLIEEVLRHQVPIGQMGNYQEHLKKLNPLRELDSGAVRTQLFGNPFKLERPADNKRDVDIGIFADEHMVEMNRRPTAAFSKRRRLQSPSPRPPTPISTPPSSTNAIPLHANNQVVPDKTNDVEKIPVESCGEFSPEEEVKLPVAKEVGLPVTKEMRTNQAGGQFEATVTKPSPPDSTSEPGRLHSSPLPEEKNGGKYPLDKLQQISRKRERTPSPTPMTSAPLPKRQAIGDVAPSPLSSTALIPRGGGGLQNHNIKAPSPVQGLVASRLGKPEISSASKVLNEEIQKQQEMENAKLKTLIVKEVRKPGKNYDVIFQLLEALRGSVEVRKGFVREIMKEAGKFKRKQLIQQLEEWGARLTSLKPAGTHGAHTHNKITTQKR